MEWIGPHGIGVRNERGERLMNFAAANKLYITNSFFQKQKTRYWTWESPGGAYKNQIDFVLTNDKTICNNTEVITKVDIGMFLIDRNGENAVHCLLLSVVCMC